MMRSILIFPQFKKINQIQAIRQEIDPLYPHIRPHISLVFPFDSSISDHELIQVLTRALTGVSAFQISFSTVSGDPQNGYVWLAASKGREAVKRIHDRLYSQPELAPFERKELSYVPHVTLGQLATTNQAQTEIQKLRQKQLAFSTTIDKVSIEHILANDDSDEFYQEELK